MRVLILGGNGMLGHDLLVAYSDRHDVKVTLRNNLKEYDRYNLFTRENSFDGIDIRSTDNVKSVLKKFSPDVVINATGIVKQRDDASSFIPSIEINALFPHKLNDICGEAGSRLIHMSTDCVFSGKKGNYTEDDFADADDLYGRSKFLGEVTSDNCITIRSSIIGLELQHKKSLIEWFLSQKGEIRGFRKAIYTGLTTMEMARVIERILLEYTGLNGIYHIASMPISKFDLLSELSRLLDRRDIMIIPDDTFVCDRSLNAEYFRKLTGYLAPAWNNMLGELADRIKSREKGESV